MVLASASRLSPTKRRGLPVDFAGSYGRKFFSDRICCSCGQGEQTNPLAPEMAECIITKAEVNCKNISQRPVGGRTTDAANSSAYPENI